MCIRDRSYPAADRPTDRRLFLPGHRAVAGPRRQTDGRTDRAPVDVYRGRGRPGATCRPTSSSSSRRRRADQTTVTNRRANSDDIVLSNSLTSVRSQLMWPERSAKGQGHRMHACTTRRRQYVELSDRLTNRPRVFVTARSLTEEGSLTLSVSHLSPQTAPPQHRGRLIRTSQACSPTSHQ